MADPDAERAGPKMFALDVAPDQSTASIAVAWKRPDGAIQVGLADHRPGVEWVVGRASDLVKSWGGKLVVESTGTAAFLIPPLERERVPVNSVPRRFYADACSALDAAIGARQVRHDNEAALNDAVASARWSTSGEAGQRIISGRNLTVSPLVAATLALHSLTASPCRNRFLIL